MSELTEKNNTAAVSSAVEEKKAKAIVGMPILLLVLLLSVLSIVGIIFGAFLIDAESYGAGVSLLVVSILYLAVGMPILVSGLKVLKPNEAYVLTLFGKYYGTLKGPGFFFTNPFVTAVNPGAEALSALNASAAVLTEGNAGGKTAATTVKNTKKLSLKAMTLSNSRQKINDELGNPIEIGIIVIWRIIDTTKAVFNVDNYCEYLSIQCDSALRNIVRLYPYDAPEDSGERSLRGSSQEISDKLKDAIQEKVDVAGIEIMEARITHLAYAPEIAAAMLQRQQAAAIIDARKMIVDGAVGMVEMALEKLNENQIVELDEERKAAMVSNLLVVLCGNKDAQPIVNSGSLY